MWGKKMCGAASEVAAANLCSELKTARGIYVTRNRYSRVCKEDGQQDEKQIVTGDTTSLYPAKNTPTIYTITRLLILNP